MISVPLFTYYFPALFLSFSFNRILRKRIDLGVTSTYSSSCMYSMCSSRLILMAGGKAALSSLPAARKLVSCLASVTFNTKSPLLLFSPTIWPS